MTYNTQRLIHEFQTQGGYSPSINAEQLDKEFDLVAAAPDLLAALEGLLEDALALGLGSSDMSGSAIAARDAIAKAKGDA